MQFWKLNILLVVLVFSFDHIRSTPQHYAPVAKLSSADADEGVNDADQGVDDADQGVDDADEGVDDADQRVNDADQGVDDADQGVDGADEGVDDADEGVDDTDESVGDSDESVGDADEGVSDANEGVGDTAVKDVALSMSPDSGSSLAKEKAPISDQCKPGQWFYTKGCNICYCYAEGNQGCTDIHCKKDTKMTLLGNPKKTQAYKKLRDTATSCVPGEKFKSNGCNCNCVIPSVMTCDKNCVNQ